MSAGLPVWLQKQADAYLNKMFPCACKEEDKRKCNNCCDKNLVLMGFLKCFEFMSEQTPLTVKKRLGDRYDR